MNTKLIRSRNRKPQSHNPDVIRNIGLGAALLSVGVAIPAAIFVEPIAMTIAAGAASVAAILTISRHSADSKQQKSSSHHGRLVATR